MKIKINSISLVFAVLIIFLEGCGNPQPSEIDVQNYLKANMPEWLAIDSLKMKSFIDGNTGTGRTSVAVTLTLTEPIFRQASQQEVEQALSKFDLIPNDLSKFNPPNFKNNAIFINSHQKDEKFTTATELKCQTRAQGWVFGGSPNISAIDGKPRSTVPSSAIIIGTPESERYFVGISDLKKAGAERVAKYIDWLKSYFAKNQNHAGKLGLGLKNPYPITLTITNHPFLEFKQDDKIGLQVFGKIHWNGDIRDNRGNITVFVQDHIVCLTGTIDTPKKENEQFSGLVYISWYNQEKKDFTNYVEPAKLVGSKFEQSPNLSFYLEPLQ